MWFIIGDNYDNYLFKNVSEYLINISDKKYVIN